MDLVCPAGSLPALKAAIDNGAACVYIGFRDDTNARNFPGLNFDPTAAREGVRYAHARKRPAGMATELFGYGRLPLAFSARCFTACYHNLQKDSCEFRCIEYPDGLGLNTREGQPFLVFNGIQTQSAQIQNLIRELDALTQAGVDVLRISPQSAHTLEIAALFRQCLERSIKADAAARQMENLMPGRACNGYWHGKPGLEQVVVPGRV